MRRSRRATLPVRVATATRQVSRVISPAWRATVSAVRPMRASRPTTVRRARVFMGRSSGAGGRLATQTLILRHSRLPSPVRAAVKSAGRHADRAPQDSACRARHPPARAGLPGGRQHVGGDHQHRGRVPGRRVLPPDPRGRARPGPAPGAPHAEEAPPVRPQRRELPRVLARPRRPSTRGAAAGRGHVLREVPAPRLPGTAGRAVPAPLRLDRQRPRAPRPASGRHSVRRDAGGDRSAGAGRGREPFPRRAALARHAGRRPPGGRSPVRKARPVR